MLSLRTFHLLLCFIYHSEAAEFDICVSRVPQVECEKAALLSRLQESQAQLQHTQLTEQHEKNHSLSQKVLQPLHGRAHVNGGDLTSAVPKHLYRDEDEADEQQEMDKERKSQLFAYQTPGLEILQYKYRVAVTEVAQLKAEVKGLRERLAQCGDVAAEPKPRRSSELQKLERQVGSLQKSYREGRDKVNRQRAE